jgi:hypothetical protein
VVGHLLFAVCGLRSTFRCLPSAVCGLRSAIFWRDRQLSSTIDSGRGCVPVGALVFKISGRRRRAGCGGFDSHAFPPFYGSIAVFH